MKTIIVQNEKETFLLAQKLLTLLPQKCRVIFLEGEVGSGKTTFTKKIALLLGIKEIVNSPSYLLMKKYQYQKTKNFYHFDLYRLTQVDFSLEEYIHDEQALVIVEWGLQKKIIMPEKYITIRFFLIPEKIKQRKIIINTFGFFSSWENKI